MEKHPLTPMTDANVRRWLRLQTKGEVGLITLDTVRADSRALGDAFEAERQKGVRLVVTDAVADSDLMALGEAIAGPGWSPAVPASRSACRRISAAPASSHAGRRRRPPPKARRWCSAVPARLPRSGKWRPISKSHPGLALDPAALMTGSMTVDKAAAWIASQNGAAPIVYSTADPASVASAQQNFGRDEIAAKVEHFFAGLVRKLVDAGVRRVVVGGGETSGAVVEALGVTSLAIGEEIDPGVPALVAERNGPLGLALKSGNFGADDFFEKAVDRIGTA